MQFDPTDRTPSRGGPVRPFNVTDEAPSGARADRAQEATDRLGELGVPGAVVSIRQGPRLLVARDGAVTEVANVDPTRGTALTMGDAPAADLDLHWLLARTFPDDDAFVQVRLPDDVREAVVERARDAGLEVATEIPRERDRLGRNLNALRALKDHDLIADRGTGVVVRAADADGAVGRIAELLEEAEG